MEYTSIHSAIISILSAVITGGFVLIFVEISNRKNRENDKYRQLMTPFMQKLSAYFKYINWVYGHITNPKPDTETEKQFKNLLRIELGKYGSELIVGGGNYDVDTFRAEELENICQKINHVWYMYDRYSLERLTWNNDYSINKELVEKELAVLKQSYLSMPESVSKIAKVSGEFYTDEYQPIQYEPYRHEMMANLYHLQSAIVCISLFVVLVSLCLLVCVKIPIWLMRVATIAIVCLFGMCMMLLFVNENKQLKLINQVKGCLKKKIHIKDMSKHIKNLIEPIGLAILLMAFVWQMRSVYVNQSIYNAKIYKFEEAIDYILECEVDEALRDSSRYKGEAIMMVGYDGVLNFSAAFYEDSKDICDKKDKANYAWWWQFALYIVGSALVMIGKAWNNYEDDKRHEVK